MGEVKDLEQNLASLRPGKSVALSNEKPLTWWSKRNCRKCGSLETQLGSVVFFRSPPFKSPFPLPHQFASATRLLKASGQFPDILRLSLTLKKFPSLSPSPRPLPKPFRNFSLCISHLTYHSQFRYKVNPLSKKTNGAFKKLVITLIFKNVFLV